MKNKFIVLLFLVSSYAMGQTSSPSGNQNNIGGNESQVGAALNNQTYAKDSNNNSGNTTINGGNASNGGTIVNQAGAPSNTTTTIKTTPNLYAPNVSSSGIDTCLGASSGGLSILGLGVTGGSTWTDQNCVMLKQVKLLAEIGLKDAAVVRLMQDPAMRDALLTAYPAFAKFDIKPKEVIETEPK